MITVIIRNRSKAAKPLVEFLKTQPYADVLQDEDINNLQAKDMKTVINFKKSSRAAKRMLEFLKNLPFAKIYDKSKPNAATLRAMKEVKAGKTTTYKNAEELIAKLHQSNHSKK